MTDNRVLRSSTGRSSSQAPEEPVEAEDQAMEEATATPDQDKHRSCQKTSQEPASSIIPTATQHPEVDTILVQLN